jgi:hypothetical protein
VGDGWSNFAEFFLNLGDGIGFCRVLLSTKPDPKDPTHLDSAIFFHNLDSLVKINNNLISGLTNYVLTIDPSQVKSISDVYHILQNNLKTSADTTGLK